MALRYISRQKVAARMTLAGKDCGTSYLKWLDGLVDEAVEAAIHVSDAGALVDLRKARAYHVLMQKLKKAF